MRLVKDTNVFVSALKSGAGASRELLLQIFSRKHTPLLGDKLWYEYLDLLGRADVWQDCEWTPEERAAALDALAAVCEFVPIFRIWRPNLADEGDNHIMELCINGNAAALVTFNVSDFKGAMFAPAGMGVMPPAEFLKRYL